jgi:Uma2 family endonuclease
MVGPAVVEASAREASGPPMADSSRTDDQPGLILPLDLRLSPEQFARVCEANPDAVLELAADGQLILMTPTGGETGARNHSLGLALGLAARSCAVPLKLFDSSSGFRLPDGSVLSPDASAVRLGWLLFPEERAVEVWRREGEEWAAEDVERIEEARVLEGGKLFPGLRLELAEIWET